MLDYGIVGNCITNALISKRGEVEWMCFPDLASPSVFARILDRGKGGSFSIRPIGRHSVSQRYIENTNILETTFRTPSGSFRVIDFFPRYRRIAKRRSRIVKENYLVRIIEPLSGKPSCRVRIDPRLDYSRGETVREAHASHVEFANGDQRLILVSNADHDAVLNGKVITLDRRRFFLVGRPHEPYAYTMKRVLGLFRHTKDYWQRWVGTLVLPEQNRDLIIRSALALKLLTYSATGAIVAAATTSIPEELGTARCFDYRFCWVRDAAYTIDALNKIGRVHEAKRFIDFIMRRLQDDDHIQILYGIHGETRIKEGTLPHLEGFRGSGPVRVGNAAYNQDQFDIFGELVDVLYLYFVYYGFEKAMSRRYWKFLRWLVNQIRFKWDKRDAGIWEFRGILEHFTYSKLMCFVGVDRAIKIAQFFKRDELVVEWFPIREEIIQDLVRHGYNEETQAFTIFYGSKELDASLLHMTYHEFLKPNDPRIVNTVKAIYRTLRHGHLVQRYSMEDDFGKPTSSFTICSFWLVDALFYIGEERRARELFARLTRCSNHLGLFSEDISIKGRRLLGNFPQAYAHIALINTAILLSEWSTKRRKIDWHEIRPESWF
ncbi:glycoside hydrolase family 15 protein [Candidatus Woesearchaeota archaeon]|nr:glycoside hydrolase family 15 protein [Candidatus Woesearchaeota archaeon]